jgi:chemotaxis response regulator CheB
MKFKDKLGRDKNEISNIAVAQARATGKVDPGVAIIVAGSLSQSSSDSSTNISIDLNQSSNVPSKVIGKK